jgi:hypothetical protein
MNKTKAKNPSLKDIFEEVRALRQEVSMFFPTESLAGYKHPERIIASYKKAIAKHPAYAGRKNS